MPMIVVTLMHDWRSKPDGRSFLAGKCYRCCAPHAGIAAGDQRLSAKESTRTAIAMFAVIGAWIHLACEAGPGLGLLLEGRLWIFLGGVGEFLRHCLVSFRGCGPKRNCRQCRTGPDNLSPRYWMIRAARHPLLHLLNMVNDQRSRTFLLRGRFATSQS